jgi:hypothetical protein
MKTKKIIALVIFEIFDFKFTIDFLWDFFKFEVFITKFVEITF